MNSTTISNKVVVDASMKASSAKIYRLQYLRAIAALSVVFCHATYYVLYFRGANQFLWDIFAEAGEFGVLLFFSISGYLMAHLAQSTPAWRFLAHRVLRIYPPYWLCMAAVILEKKLSGSALPNPLTLLLAPGATFSVIGVEWTLPFELTYYLIVFLVIAVGLRQQLPKLAVLWILIIAVLYGIRPDLQQGLFPTLLHLPLSVYSLAFAGGLLVPTLVKYRLIGPATPILAIALLAVSYILPGVGLSVGAACAGGVLLVATAVRPHEEETSTPNRSFVALGDWSYALYLCHVPIILFLCRHMTNVPEVRLWAAAIATPLIVAIGFGKLDILVYRHLKKLIDNTTNNARIIFGVGFLVVLLCASATPYIQDIRRIEASQASTNSAPLGNQLAAIINNNHVTLDKAAQSAGLRPDMALRGHFYYVQEKPLGFLQMKGWAESSTDDRVRVLIFACGHYLGAPPPLDSWRDIALALHLYKGRYWFNETLHTSAACPVGVEALLVSFNGGYGVISAPLSSLDLPG